MRILFWNTHKNKASNPYIAGLVSYANVIGHMEYTDMKVQAVN